MRCGHCSVNRTSAPHIGIFIHPYYNVLTFQSANRQNRSVQRDQENPNYSTVEQEEEKRLIMEKKEQRGGTAETFEAF